MRNVITVLVLAAVLAAGATVVQAVDPPVDGIYKSTNGDFLEGRSSVSWNLTPDRLEPGNILNVESFDGANLGTEWRVYCTTIVNVVLLYDLVFGGNGQRAYLITYAGGFIELDGNGPWGGTSPPAKYSGTIDVYVETRTQQYAGGNLVGTNSNHQVTASLTGFSAGCLSVGVGNDAIIGDTDPNLIPVTDTNVLPADYPSFLSGGCVNGPVDGRWGDTIDLTITVNSCTVPTAEKTWGQVKSVYTD